MTNLASTDERITDDELEAMLEATTKATGFHDGNLIRYEHGGGRLAITPVPGDGERKLIADFFDQGDREHFVLCSPDRIASIVSELLERRKAETWQPIETAPKDGTEILAVDATGIMGDNFQQVVYWGEWEHLSPPSYGWVICDIDVGPMRPPFVFTHWRPLPLPPGTSP